MRTNTHTKNKQTNKQARTQTRPTHPMFGYEHVTKTWTCDWMNGEVPSCPSKSLTAPTSFINITHTHTHNSHEVHIHDQDPGRVVFYQRECFSHFNQTVIPPPHKTHERKEKMYIFTIKQTNKKKKSNIWFVKPT